MKLTFTGNNSTGWWGFDTLADKVVWEVQHDPAFTATCVSFLSRKDSSDHSYGVLYGCSNGCLVSYRFNRDGRTKQEILRQHAGRVISCDALADYSLAASLGEDCFIRVWDLTSCTMLHAENIEIRSLCKVYMLASPCSFSFVSCGIVIKVFTWRREQPSSSTEYIMNNIKRLNGGGKTISSERIAQLGDLSAISKIYCASKIDLELRKGFGQRTWKISNNKSTVGTFIKNDSRNPGTLIVFDLPSLTVRYHVRLPSELLFLVAVGERLALLSVCNSRYTSSLAIFDLKLSRVLTTFNIEFTG